MRFETNDQLLETVAKKTLERRNARTPVTRSQVIATVRELLAREEARRTEAPEAFNFARAIRGLFALRHSPLVMEDASEDAAFASRALATGTQPGSFLVPTIQANAIIGQLSQFATARAAGARIWPMKHIQSMNVPAAVAGAPSFIWQAQNSRQIPSDPNAAQLAFDLKLAQALISIPIQLFRSALPQWDLLLQESFALGLAEAEDSAMHASATLSASAPLALMSQGGITTLNAAGGAASGGNLLFSDLLATIQRAADSKIRQPWCWFMAGRTLVRILSLTGTTSNPVVELEGDDLGPMAGRLFGWPVFVTSSIATNEAVGSGSNQSHIVLTNPRSIHVAESGDLSLEVSTDFALDSADVAVRIGHKVAFGYQPSASIISLQGIN